MKKILVAVFLLFCFVASAHAELPTDWQSPTDLISGAMNDALKQITTTLEKAVVSIIFALALLQISITGIKQISGGDVEKPLVSLGMNFLWIGMALWLLATAIQPVEPGGISNLSDLLYRIQHFAMGIVSTMTGDVEFSAGAILAIGLQSYGLITLSVAKVTSTNLVNALATIMLPGVGFVTALMTFFVSVVIMISCAYLALKVFITKIEFSILMAIAPLNIALMVFAPTRDQGWAPFKGALALVYRILILGGVVAAIGIVAKALATYVDGQAYGLIADVWTPLLSAAFAFSLLAFIAHKSDSIASSMASGSSSMTSGDLASSVATGVAAAMTGGAAIAAAGAASAGGTGIKAMGDVMKGMADASPTMKGIQSVKSSLGLGGGGDKPPQKPSAPSFDKQPARPSAGGDGGGTGEGSGGGSMSPSTAAQSIDNMVADGRATNPEAAKAVSDHLKSMPDSSQSTSPSPSGGSGASAGIGGGTDTPQTPAQEKMMAAVGKFMNQGSNLSRKMEQDNTSTSVNLNTHHTD